MLLKKIAGHNFSRYEDVEVELQPGLTVIIGPIGTGKTSLTEIVQFCLVGSVNGTKKDALRDGTSSGWGSVEFELHGQEGSIKKDLHTSSSVMDFGGDEITGVDAVTRTLCAALETERQTVENVVFAPQGELARILFQKPAEREKMFHRIFGLEKMARIEKVLGNEEAKYGGVTEMREMRASTETELDGVRKEIGTLQQEHEGYAAQMAGVELDAIQKEYNAAQSAAKDLEDLLKAKRNSEATEVQLTQERTQQPVTDDQLTAIEVHLREVTAVLERLRREHVQADKVLQLLASETAQCPVCGSQLTNTQELRTHFETSRDNAAAEIATTTSRMNEAESDLARMRSLYRQYEGRITQLQTSLQQYNEQVVTLAARIPPEIPPLKAVQIKLANYLQIQTEATRIASRIQALTERANALEIRFIELSEQLGVSDRIESYLEVAETCRKAFHYTRIPRVAAQQNLDDLNLLVEKYAGWFNNPFETVISSNYSMQCSTGNAVRKPTRLSGGERTIMALCLRLALHEMFASNFGFLWLDEPTVFLDKPRIEMFCNALDNVKQAASTEMGTRQVFVITHHEEILPFADNVIDVTKL